MNEIYLLTETQQKIDKLEEKENIIKIIKMREPNDKKVGGMMVLYRVDNKFVTNHEEKETRSKDILDIEFKIGPEKCRIILVYLSVTSPGSNLKNKQMYDEITEKMENYEHNILVLGDFNGHIDGLGYQVQDFNGEIVLNLMNFNNLIFMNMDIRCEGMYTWERGLQRSVIDYVLINNKMHKLVDKIKIDEDKEIFDLSDHDMKIIELKVLQTKRFSGKTIVHEENIQKRR